MPVGTLIYDDWKDGKFTPLTLRVSFGYTMRFAYFMQVSKWGNQLGGASLRSGSGCSRPSRRALRSRFQSPGGASSGPSKEKALEAIRRLARPSPRLQVRPGKRFYRTQLGAAHPERPKGFRAMSRIGGSPAGADVCFADPPIRRWSPPEPEASMTTEVKCVVLG